jgi:CBS domain-containing protein
MEAAMEESTRGRVSERPVTIPAGTAPLHGDLARPDGPRGIVLFAHGSGSSRHSPRNRHVAGVLQQAGLATLLMDLLTEEEEAVDARTAHLRFDITLLAERLAAATDWLTTEPTTTGLAVGYFGASTGAGAALVAAARRPDVVRAVVSRGGRPDLAGGALARVTAPTLLIVGGHDLPVIGMNREAMARMRAEVRLEIVPGATHLFEEPGTLETAARLARDWFVRHLARQSAAGRSGDMDVNDIMTRDPITIDPDAPVGTAIAVMVERKIRHLPVVDERGAVIGIITDRDLRSLALTPGAEPYLPAAVRGRLRGIGAALENVRVNDVMTCNPVTTRSDAAVGQAAALMLERQIGSLPVVDDGKLVGIVTDRDAVKALMTGLPALKSAAGWLW